VKEGEIALLEDLKELVPGRLFELLVVLAEVEAKNPPSSFSGSHDRGPPAAFFSPATDLVMISGRSGLAHRFLPMKLNRVS